MPHFGAKVIGAAAYERARAFEMQTGNNHFGNRVTGAGAVPEAPVAPAVPTKSVRAIIAELKEGGDVIALTTAELAREDGARKSVVKALLSEATRRGASQELVDSLMTAKLAGEDEE